MARTDAEARARARRGAQRVAQLMDAAVPPLNFPGSTDAAEDGPETKTARAVWEADLDTVAAYLVRVDGNESWVELTGGKGRWRSFAEVTHEIVSSHLWEYEDEAPWARYRLCIGSQQPGTVRIFLRKEYLEGRRLKVEAYRSMVKESGPGLVARVPPDKRGVIVGWDDSLIADQTFPAAAFEAFFEADPDGAPAAASMGVASRESVGQTATAREAVPLSV
jgi:hypothetical protein